MNSPDRSRVTRQKRAVSAALESTETFRSAQELHADLRARGEDVGLTTVYTQLRALAAAREVDTMDSESGETLYRRCASAEHHHHLVCRRCRRTVEVDGPALELWADEVSARHGFSDTTHRAEVVGTCSQCQ